MTKKKRMTLTTLFLFLLSESYRGLEFCSNTLKAVITQLFCGTNEQEEESRNFSSEDTVTEYNTQPGGEKENFCAKIPTFQNEICCCNMDSAGLLHIHHKLQLTQALQL